MIVLLGILASFALPRFINITKEAHNANVSGTAGAIATAVSISHAKWMASGQPITIPPIAGIDFTNSGHADVGFNQQGWPNAATNGTADIIASDVLGGGGNNNAICAQIMKNLLATSSVSFGMGENCSQQYCAVYKAPDCIYTYQQSKDISRKIVYSTLTGSVNKISP